MVSIAARLLGPPHAAGAVALVTPEPLDLADLALALDDPAVDLWPLAPERGAWTVAEIETRALARLAVGSPRRRVIVLASAERLGRAADRLLLPLERATPPTRWILVTPSLGELPVTLRSRLVDVVTLSPIGDPDRPVLAPTTTPALDAARLVEGLSPELARERARSIVLAWRADLARRVPVLTAPSDWRRLARVAAALDRALADLERHGRAELALTAPLVTLGTAPLPDPPSEPELAVAPITVAPGVLERDEPASAPSVSNVAAGETPVFPDAPDPALDPPDVLDVEDVGLARDPSTPRWSPGPPLGGAGR